MHSLSLLSGHHGSPQHIQQTLHPLPGDPLTLACCRQVDALTPVDPVSNTSVTLLTAPVVPANAAALPVDQLPFAQVPSVIPSVCLPLHLLCSGDASVWEAWEATASWKHAVKHIG